MTVWHGSQLLSGPPTPSPLSSDLNHVSILCQCRYFLSPQEPQIANIGGGGALSVERGFGGYFSHNVTMGAEE